MREPQTAEDVLAFQKLADQDPQQGLRIANAWIDDNPESSTAYFSRHQIWMSLGDTARALADLDRAIELDPSPTDYRARGNVHRRVGDYGKAVADYAQAEAMDPAAWRANPFALTYQADAYARLGDEPAALACWARLPDDFWTPGYNDLPPGGKAEIAAELRRRSAAARGDGR